MSNENLGSLRVDIGLNSSAFTSGIQAVNRRIKALDSEFKALTAGAGKFDNSIDSLKSKSDVLSRTLQTQSSKLKELRRQYEQSAQAKGKDSAEAQKMLIQYNKAYAAMKKTEDQLQLVNRRLAEQSTGYGKLSSKLNASVNSMTTRLRALDASFDAVTAGVSNFGRTSDQLRQKQQHLTQSMQLQQQRIKDLRRLYLESKRAKGADADETQRLSIRLSEATREMRLTERQLDTTNRAIQTQSTRWGRFGATLDRTGERLRDVGNRLQSTGAEIATSFGIMTAAVGGGLVLSTKKAADFEQQMSSVYAVMDPAEVKKYQKQLKQLAITLGADTKYSALEAGQGMEEIIKAGVSIKDTINGGLSGALSLATAGELDLAAAAEIASTALNAFKADNLTVAKSADILSGAAVSSATTVEELRYGLQMSSAVAAGMGLTFKDTATSLAVFAQNGLKGSDAGTSLKTMLARLVPMTKPAMETMEDLGLVTLNTKRAFDTLGKEGFKPASMDLEDIVKAVDKYVISTTGLKKGTGKFEKAWDEAAKSLGLMDNKFFDTNGNLKSMADISGELAKALDGLSAKDRQEALYKIFGSDAIRGALILGKEGKKGFDAMAGAMDKIKADKVAEQKMDNLKGKIEELSGAVETAQISFGDALTPAISKVVDVLQAATDWFNGLSDRMKSILAISAAVVTALLGMVAALGFVMMGVGQVITGVGALLGVLKTLATSGKLLAGLQIAFAALTGPIGLITLGISAIVIAFTVAYKKSETFRKVVDKSLQGVKKAAGITAAFISKIFTKAWNGLTSGLTKAAKGLQTTFKKISSTVGKFFKKTGEKVANNFSDGLLSKVKNIAETFFAQLKVAFSSLGGAASLLAPTLTAIGLALAGVSGPVGIAITAIVSLTSFLYRLYKSNDNFKKNVDSSWKSIKSAVSGAIKALTPIIAAFSQMFADMSKELGPAFADTMTVLKESVETLKPAFEDLKTAFKDLWVTVTSMIDFKAITDVVEKFVTNVVPVLSKFITAVLKNFLTLNTEVIKLVLGIVKDALPLLASTLKAIAPSVVQVVKTITVVIKELLSLLGPAILEIIRTVLPAFFDVIKATFPIIASIVVNLIKVLGEVIKVILPLLLEVVKLIMPIITEIFKYGIQGIVALLNGLAWVIETIVVPVIKGILEIIKIVFPVIVSIIKGAIGIITNIFKFFTSILQGDWSGAWDAIVGIFGNAWDIIASIFTGGSNLLTIGWDGLKGKMSTTAQTMWNKIKDKFWKGVEKVKAYVSDLVTSLPGKWEAIKNRAALFATGMWTKIKEKFDDIVGGAKKLPGRIGRGIVSMAFKAVDGIKTLGKRMMKTMVNVVNGVIGGVNWVLGKVGLGDKKLPLWAPEYAKGTDGHPGGPAIVGDGGMSEAVILPNGKTFMSPSTDTFIPNLPRGTQVISGPNTRKLMRDSYRYKNGTGLLNGVVDGAKNLIGGAKGALSKLKDSAFDVWGMIGNPKALFNKVLDMLGVGSIDFGGGLSDLGRGVTKIIKDAFLSFIKKHLSGMMDFGGGGVGGGKVTGNVKSWVAQAIKITGISPSYAKALETIAMKESSGNPTLVNRWDSNARAGHPSQGLMQFIPTTFAAYSKKGFKDITNPVHQVVAAINYLNRRYGGIYNHPGLKSMARGGPYIGYKNGGSPQSDRWAFVGEQGPELVRLPGGSRVYPNKKTHELAGTNQAASSVDNTALLQRQIDLQQQEISLLTRLVAKDNTIAIPINEITSQVDRRQAASAAMEGLMKG